CAASLGPASFASAVAPSLGTSTSFESRLATSCPFASAAFPPSAEGSRSPAESIPHAAAPAINAAPAMQAEASFLRMLRILVFTNATFIRPPSSPLFGRQRDYPCSPTRFSDAGFSDAGFFDAHDQARRRDRSGRAAAVVLALGRR